MKGGSKYRIGANLVDVIARNIFPAEVYIEGGKISGIRRSERHYDQYLMPGFVDAHVHIESAMVTPSEFGKIAIQHGTVATVSDPHEIANVMGLSGVEFMISDAMHTPVKILFGAPSCVPATGFETSGAAIFASDIDKLLREGKAGFLSEVMNYPGVIYGDDELNEKLKTARKYNVPIDGHAPGLGGEDLNKYAAAGIKTDHECFSLNEAREKILNGMSIQIREGSAAKNFKALIPLLEEFPDKIMFCTDDIHPDDLIRGHINVLVKDAVVSGYDLFDVLRAASFNTIKHYGLDVGLLQEGDSADFILVDSLEDFNICKVFIEGKLRFDGKEVYAGSYQTDPVNNFEASQVGPEDFRIVAKGRDIKVIEARDGELITGCSILEPKMDENFIIPDPDRDILKVAVVNRYNNSKPEVAFIKGFGLKNGAIASSIAHDSHNIVCVGTSDSDMSNAVNWIMAHKGGIVAVHGDIKQGIPLPVAGIMSDQPLEWVADKYAEVSEMARNMGSDLGAPFMTLSFMALLVIPELKISDKGLFDGRAFKFTTIYVEEDE